MEVKINREIRKLHGEYVFSGCPCGSSFFLPWRLQWPWGLLLSDEALCRTETVSWVCVLGAAPFAALGFFTYHGMAAEQFIWAWAALGGLEPRELRFEASTLYYDLLKPSIDKWEKRNYKRHD